MPRLIDAEALKKELRRWLVNPKDWRTIPQIVDAQPTIENKTEDLMLAIATLSAKHAKEKLDLLKMIKDVAEYRSRWIPVMERLPEERRTVLVSSKNGKVGTNSWMGRVWQYENERNPVTHWMPLPQPPEQDGASWSVDGRW